MGIIIARVLAKIIRNKESLLLLSCKKIILVKITFNKIQISSSRSRALINKIAKCNKVKINNKI